MNSNPNFTQIQVSSLMTDEPPRAYVDIFAMVQLLDEMRAEIAELRARVQRLESELEHRTASN